MTRVVTAAKSSEAAAAQRRGATRLGLEQAQAHTRAPASLREAALELETVEPATARKTDATDSAYATRSQYGFGTYSQQCQLTWG